MTTFDSTDPQKAGAGLHTAEASVFWAPATELLGRAALAAIFLLAGINKLGSYEGTQGYMASVGLPGELLPGVIVLEIVGAALLVAGVWTRAVALVLAAFCVVSGLLFHFQFSDSTQFILFWKNIAMAGGFLIVASHPAGAWSIDARRGRSAR